MRSVTRKADHPSVQGWMQAGIWRAYPDVAPAIITGALDSAEQHFLVAGYLERRLPCDPEIDADWYDANRPTLEGLADKRVECLHHFMQVDGALPRRSD